MEGLLTPPPCVEGGYHSTGQEGIWLLAIERIATRQSIAAACAATPASSYQTRPSWPGLGDYVCSRCRFNAFLPSLWSARKQEPHLLLLLLLL